MTLNQLIDPITIIKTLGLLGVILIIFAESGLLIGFIFPGDSLLFTAGLLASQGFIPFIPLAAGTFIAAALGDNLGYFFGKKVGIGLFTKEDSMFFKRKHVARAEKFYEKYGKKTIILARFIPIVRTFAPVVAGIANMEYKSFVRFNIIGAAIWAIGISTLGYTLGLTVPGIKQYLTPIIILIVLTSFLPGIIEYFINRRKKI